MLILKEGDGLIIVPASKSGTSFADDAPPVDDDFMAERPDLMDWSRR